MLSVFALVSALYRVAQQHMEPLGAAQSHRHSTAATANSMALNISYASLFSGLYEKTGEQRGMTVARYVCVFICRTKKKQSGKCDD